MTVVAKITAMTPSLSADEIDSGLSSLDGWELQGKAIAKTFSFEGFTQSIDFVDHVASAAEEADHHPDIDIRFDKVTLTLSTHSEGGVTDKDLKLAEAIEEIVA